MTIKALLFDVFGTIVDWREGMIREGGEFARANGIQPSLDKVRTGEVPWRPLDDIHRAGLEQLIARYGITGISAAALDHFNRAWHRLKPWPDSVAGLNRLRQKYILAPCSNGNVALMVNLARYAGLPWDTVLGAEVAHQYKPRPEVYQQSVALLRLQPVECVLVAAHNYDLAAAAVCGLQCAFIPRPQEFGPNGKPDLTPSKNWQLIAKDMNHLATQLGC